MDLHYIVDKLKAPPFSYNLTLLGLSEKSSSELLQLVTDVFAKISPKHQNIDVENEEPDQTADRLMSFLKIVKYKPPTSFDPATFRALLSAGDKDVIYGILKWVVPQPQVLEKRAFVGYYLSFPDMPDEFNYDADIMELKEEIKSLQQDFIEVHKANDSVKSLNKDTQAVKAKIKSLEEEKERLSEKVERAKSQVDKVPDKQTYMDVCTALRKQQDEEVNLSTQLQTQKQLQEKAEGSYHKVNARLRELQSSYQEGSAAKLLDTLKEDVNNLRFQVNERYPKELEKRQKRAQALQEAFTNGVNTEMDLQRLQGQANTLHTQIQEIQERRAAADRQRQGDKSFLQLRQAQQMAQMVARKKEELNTKLERLQEKKANLTSQFEKLTADGSGAAIVSEEEWRQKYEAMKAALPQYKKMKKELGDIEAEVFVLAYTEELLQQQDQTLSSMIKQIERKQGIAGFADVANNLEKVSEQKSAIDEVKGMTLAEISRTVEEINASINDRKVRLAPQIKRLRQVRQQFAELEAEHNNAKQGYDAAMSQYESRVSSLEGEVMALKGELMENESKFHLLHCQLNITDQNIKKVSSGPTAERLKDKYQQKLAESEDQVRVLKDKQKEIKETHTTGLSQIDMMNDLIKLLQIKLEVQKREMGIAVAPSGGGGFGGVDLSTLAAAPPSMGAMGQPMRSGMGAMPQPHSFDTPSGANVMVL
mmetsp:Transcript_9266/g.19811  ORF Transcript_9266/g.19811 Transcript_9266/m.19811 type:complete len:706 (+) Transcript_9266:158-2275(+)|eukprot:CAMPEP_0202902022 /NCGR_PEP_ID=MMETSP1392-20130828/15905_1 /ASSEMBLY_ACC=CAM_ASM_000868 /TAXON_ID=225041 /ORGANISM="Chlamydomonas chlamydogama, Strain SAG 11-48b" /LENGTH=705 /DNA_ID=CAMNT_0049588701 /DNA_START=148 /DNA_END=2265 /DNA_ORIENTATION=+